MSDSLLASKLHLPAPRAAQIARPDLVARLDAGLQGRLTLVSAPAGFGKTTLVASWARRAAEHRAVAWLSLDEADNDPRRWLAHLIAALDQVQPGVRVGVQSALQAPQLPPLEIVLASLVNELARSDRPGTLILDDYHVLEAEAIHSAFAFLVEHLPPSLHLVLLSRSDPLGLPLARLRARAQLNEIRAQDLRFQDDEAAEFLNVVMGLKLSADDVAVLAQRTEGWAVGLQLAGLALQGRADPSAFVQAFAGSQVYVADYLAGEVLTHQSESVRAFLLQTSILERLSAPLCDAVLGKRAGEPASLGGLEDEPNTAAPLPSHSRDVLEQLDRANLFLVPLDTERHWYRYHHLFADLLRAHLQRTWPGRVADLHARAAAWFQSQGSLREAVEHWLAAGQVASAAELLEQHGHARWMEADIAFLELIGRLPPPVVESRPSLGLHLAWDRVRRGQHAQVVPQLQTLAGRLANLPADEARAGMLEFVRMMQAYVNVMQGTVSGDTLEILQAQLAAIPAGRLAMHNAAGFMAGYAHFIAGDFVPAEQLWNEAIERDRAAGAAEAIAICVSRLALLRMVQGRLHAAASLCRAGLQLMTPQNQWAFYVGGNLHVVLGLVLLEWNDLEAAGEQILAGLRINELWRIPHAVALGDTALARLRLVEGDPAAAQTWLDQEARLLQGLQIHPDLVADFEACQVRVWLAEANTAALTRWRREHDDFAAGPAAFRDEARQLTLARVLIAERQPDDALKLLIPLGEAALAAGRHGRHLEILILQAMAHQVRGHMATALAALQPGLTLAEPEGYQRIFVDEGEPMRALLAQVQSRTEFVRQLLAAFPIGQMARPAHRPEPGVPAERLTEREQEVLRLMADGLNNQEIAARLVVGVGTVKTHVHNVLGKLQASHRAQAIARARELGFL